MLHRLFHLLTLPLLTSLTLLFYVPDSPSSPELKATISYGIEQLSRSLWYDLDHKIVNSSDENLVRSLVGGLSNVTAVMGVFTDDQLKNITPLVDAFGIPTFVLNQVTNFPTSPNIFLTTPSVEFEMMSLERVLDFYSWEMISYFVEADTSVTDILKGHGRCWDKHILDPSLIPRQTCKDFAVVILVGYSQFQSSFISQFTASGCRNMVVLQYFLEDQPTMVPADVNNSTEIGDLLMLFPKSYPTINTGATPSENDKYSCLSPSCMQYKINSEYKQAESVLLLLDTLKLIEILLRQEKPLQASTLRDVVFSSTTGDQTSLLDQGFSYNRMNIFKSGSVPGVELIGWADERGLKMLPTTWQSTTNSQPVRNKSAGCNLTVTSTPKLVVRDVIINFSDPTKIVTVILLIVMLVSLPIIYVSRRHVEHHVPVGIIFPYFISCVVMLLAFFFLLETDHGLLCLVMIVRDATEFMFYSMLLYLLISYESESTVSQMTFIGGLLFLKFIVAVNTLIRDSREVCEAPYFSLSSSQLYFALISMTILLVVLKHFTCYRTIRWILVALCVSMSSEAVLHFIEVPTPVQVALYSTRVFLTSVAYVFSGRSNGDSHHKKELDTEINTVNNGNLNHHYMAINEEDRHPPQTEHVVCEECAAENPQMYWEDDVELVNCPNSSASGNESMDGDRPAPSGTFPERVKLNNVMVKDNPGKNHVKECSLIGLVSEFSPRSPALVIKEDHLITSSCITRDERPSNAPSERDSSSQHSYIQPCPEEEGFLPPSVPGPRPPVDCNTPQDFTVHWSKPTEYSDDITSCYETEEKCATVGHLSGISEEEEHEEEEKEETQIRVGFRAVDEEEEEEEYDYNSDTHVTNGESGFCSGNSNTNSNSTEPEYVNIGNGGMRNDIVLLHDNNIQAMETT